MAILIQTFDGVAATVGGRNPAMKKIPGWCDSELCQRLRFPKGGES